MTYCSPTLGGAPREWSVARQTKRRGVYIDKSMFGWVMAGPLREGPEKPRQERLRVFAVTKADQRLSDQMEKQWKLEEMPGEESTEKEHNEAYAIEAEQTIRFPWQA